MSDDPTSPEGRVPAGAVFAGELPVERSEFVEALVGALHETVLFGLDREGRYLFIWTEASLVKRYGMDPPAMIGRSIGEIFGPEVGPRRVAATRELFDSGSCHREVHSFTTATGEFWHDVTLSPLRDANGRVRAVLAVARDVTEQHQLQGRLLRTQKQESLSLLACGVAHDFNNLLLGMMGNASLVRADLPADHPAARSLAQVERAALRAAELTRQLMVYAGGGGGESQPLQLAGLLGEMAELLRASIPRQVAIDLEIAAELPALKGDPTQLRQLVMNLLLNASEAIGGQDGRISLTLRRVWADDARLASTLIDDRLPAGEYLSLAVSDTGRGIDGPTLARLFDPFFTTKTSGRGLGLATVLGIVRRHRGAIQVDSLPGRGSTFEVLLPATDEAAVGSDGATESCSDDWRGQGLVLLAEDDPAVREVVGETLRRAGFEVLEAADGGVALELLATRAAELCAAVLDATMPQAGGLEVARRLWAARPELPVVLSSGYAEKALDLQAETARIIFLPKPYRPSVLVRLLCQAISPSA